VQCAVRQEPRVARPEPSAAKPWSACPCPVTCIAPLVRREWQNELEDRGDKKSPPQLLRFQLSNRTTF
jgi:hypothetical protein